MNTIPFVTRRSVRLIPHEGRRPVGGIIPDQGLPPFAYQRRWSRNRLLPFNGTREADLNTEWDVQDVKFEDLHGQYWYGGVLDDRFGHFITETASRFWWNIVHPGSGRTALFVPQGARMSSAPFRPVVRQLKNWQEDLLDYFGVDEWRIVDRPVIAQELIIPAQGSLLFSSDHYPDFTKVLWEHARNSFGASKADRRLFFSRPVAQNETVVGEEILAELFSRAGYEVVNPELLPIRDQLEMAWNATHIVGVQGSAFHLLNALGKPAAKVLLFQRLSDFSSDAFLKTLRTSARDVSVVNVEFRFKSPVGSNYDVVFPDLSQMSRELPQFDPTLAVPIDLLNRWYASFLDRISDYFGIVGRELPFER